MARNMIQTAIRGNQITDQQREEYRKIDWFWDTNMPCLMCGKCSCENETCHPNGPCEEKENKIKANKEE